MQETQVRSLIPEDPTCLGATKPVGHRGPGATTTEAPHALEPVLCNKRCHVSEKPAHRNETVAPAL